MKMQHFKTLYDLIKASRIQQLSFENFLSRQFCDKDGEWHEFMLPIEVRQEYIYGCCDCVGLEDHENVWGAFCHGKIHAARILCRLVAQIGSDDKIHYTYQAGQDWRGETGLVCSILRGIN